MSRWLICWNWKITSSSGVCRQGRPCNPRQWKQRLSHTVWFRDSGLQMMSPSLAWTELEETMESLHWNELHIHVCLHIATRMLWLKHSPNWGHSRPCPVGAALTGTITLPRNELISSASRILSHAVNSKHFGKEMRNGRWVRRVLLIRFFFFAMITRVDGKPSLLIAHPARKYLKYRSETYWWGWWEDFHTLLQVPAECRWIEASLGHRFPQTAVSQVLFLKNNERFTDHSDSEHCRSD